MTDDGLVLNENSAVLQWLGDQPQGENVCPKMGTKERYQVINTLSWLGTELHGSCRPMFSMPSAEAKEQAVATVNHKFSILNRMLEGRNYLVGDCFSVADAYAYVISTWTPFMGVDLAKFPAVKAFHDRMAASPMVKEAFARMKDNPATVV